MTSMFQRAYSIVLPALLAIGLTGIFGCNRIAPRSASAVPERIGAAPPAQNLRTELYAATPADASATATDTVPEAPIAELSLNQVLEIAFVENPTFAEFEANRALARAELLSARTWQNPELESSLSFLDGEDSSVEYEFGIAQPFELPLKRRTRFKAAEALEGLVEFEQAAFHTLLRAEVSKAYWTVVFQSRAQELAGENLELAQRILETVKSRVEAGGAPPIDLIKARVEWLSAQRTTRKSERELRIAQKILDALCGQALPAGFRARDEFETDFRAADQTRAFDLASRHNPELLSLKARLQQKQLQLKQELAARYPDLAPGIGFEHEDEADSAIVSLGVEIPLWNRNQGAIARTKAELQLLEAQLEKLRQAVLRDAGATVEEYSGALEQLELFGELRSAADEALRTETFLYEQGEADYLELTDARRTAQKLKAEYLDAIYQAHLSRLELEKIIGVKGLE